jgi:ABC-type multidrug transport system ATPase subunit
MGHGYGCYLRRREHGLWRLHRLNLAPVRRRFFLAIACLQLGHSQHKNRPAITPFATPPDAILQVDQLCFSYPQQPLFTDVSLCAPPGVTLVRGGDGAGKTTLLRLLAGELPADAGELYIHGVRLSDAPAAYQKQVFWVDPRNNAYDQISANDYFQSLQSQYPLFATPDLGRLIEGLYLTPHVDKPMYMLSTGSKRKVYLAAAFASGAALTLLDSPFAALDKPSIGFVMTLLNEAAKQPARAWVVAHYDGLGDVPLVNTVDLGL